MLNPLISPIFDISQPALDASEILITPGQEEADGYGPLPLRNLTVLRVVPFNVYLKIKKKGKMAPQFVKCCVQGEVFQPDWYQKLTQLQIPCVYVSMEEAKQVLKYLHQNLKLLREKDTSSESEKGLRVSDAMHIWALYFFNFEEGRTGEQFNLALQFLDTLFQMIESDRVNILNLLRSKRHPSFRLYNHCLNVCLLGLAYANYLGWSREKVLGFGLGALIHDIGLVRTPRDILEKEGPLTPEEMSAVKRHPIDGFRMIQIFANLRWEALQMVLQHHENGDGSGYPKGSKITAIHSWARILRILDSYEAMTARRPWREAMEPKDALWTMHSDWKKSNLFDPNYLMAFIKFLASH